MLRIDHVNIRAPDPAAMVRFLKAVLGAKEGFRPPFKHPGHWVYLEGAPAIHIDYSGSDEGLEGGVVDHVAFGVFDYEPLLERVRASGCRYELAGIPGGLGQIFVFGPEGIKIELQYAR
jgi:catechol 2,3-dioxygenase-like lactoylglutathione lyase family enzyme